MLINHLCVIALTCSRTPWPSSRPLGTCHAAF